MAFSVQRAPCIVVLLCINCSIRERLIGGVGVARVGGMEIEGRIEGGEFEGLGWVDVCCIVVIIGFGAVSQELLVQCVSHSTDVGGVWHSV